MGRPHTHIEIYGGRSQTYVEMTLVDNATGRTLWHARQKFPASAARPDHVVEMIHRMMATFPAQ